MPTFHPLTPDRWDDLERLFSLIGERVCRLLGTDSAALFLVEGDELVLRAAHGFDDRAPAPSRRTLDPPWRDAPIVRELGYRAVVEAPILLRGEAQTPKAGDMLISDGKGIISSIVYGPDQRTQISAGTRNVIFTVYAPPGISEGAVEKHLQGIRDNVLLIAPEAHVELLKVFGAR